MLPCFITSISLYISTQTAVYNIIITATLSFNTRFFLYTCSIKRRKKCKSDSFSTYSDSFQTRQDMVTSYICEVNQQSNNLFKMKKQLTLFLCLLLFIPMYGYAEDEVNHQIVQQTTKVKGTVTDEQGEPLIGASIAIKGTSQGVITDFNGQFSIDASRNAALIVSYVGYRSEEVQVKGQSNLKIVLKEDSKIIDEVVVTALGIKRERKALGYSIGEVKGEELEKAKETNVINSLAGKIPGLVISQTAGGPSGSSRVIVRGSTEMTGNNQPLYVVDGVPLDNSNYGSAGQYGGYDLGDGISSINPDDIESMSVLKGPAASALYGSRASHGVILITTKKASTKKEICSGAEQYHYFRKTIDEVGRCTVCLRTGNRRTYQRYRRPIFFQQELGTED